MFGNETEFVLWLQRRSAKRATRTRLGIGDDAAIVEVSRGHELILTTDLSIEGVHFLRKLHPPRAVGHRALARSLSDVAAMGGIPRYALISLAISRHISRAWIEELYAGIFALASRFQVSVVGGDTAITHGNTSIDVMVAGEVRRGKAIRRDGARPGDQLFVSGALGLSALGLRWLKTKGSARHRRDRVTGDPSIRKTREEALRVHLYPEPRCSLGRHLAARNLASALIDLSDGLSTDLARLCAASGVGARVWADRIPTPDDLKGSRLSSTDAIKLALHGGEDYELLFTVPPAKVAQIGRQIRDVPIHRIGEIRRAKKISMLLRSGKELPLKPAGYDHFENLTSSAKVRRTKSL